MEKDKKDDIGEETPWWNKMPEGFAGAGVTSSLPKVGKPAGQGQFRQNGMNQTWTPQGGMQGQGMTQTWQNVPQQPQNQQFVQMGSQQAQVQQPMHGQGVPQAQPMQSNVPTQPVMSGGMGRQDAMSNYATPFGGMSPQMGSMAGGQFTPQQQVPYQQTGMPNMSFQPQAQEVTEQDSKQGGKFSFPDLPWVKILGIGAVVVALVAVLGVGATFAMTMGGTDDGGEQPGIEQPQGTEEPEKVTSNIYVTVTADGTDKDSTDASVIVYKGDAGEDVAIAGNPATPGTRVLLGSLEEGSYRLHVETAPTNKDGSTYSTPFFDQTFEVKGDGADVDVKLTLDAIAPKTDDTNDGTGDGSQDGQDDQGNADSGNDKTDEPAASSDTTKDNDKSDKKATKTDKSENSGKKTTSSASSTTGQQTQSKVTKQHKHSWQPIKKTIHHKAKYRTVKHDAVKSRVTVCDECGQDITGAYSSHKASTGHSGYHYENKVTRKAYTEKVLVSKAYDETKIVGYKCKTCGKKHS